MKIVVVLCLLFNFPVIIWANCCSVKRFTARADSSEILKTVVVLIKKKMTGKK
jgi:hypothetical protein